MSNCEVTVGIFGMYDWDSHLVTLKQETGPKHRWSHKQKETLLIRQATENSWMDQESQEEANQTQEVKKTQKKRNT